MTKINVASFTVMFFIIWCETTKISPFFGCMVCFVSWCLLCAVFSANLLQHFIMWITCFSVLTVFRFMLSRVCNVCPTYNLCVFIFYNLDQLCWGHKHNLMSCIFYFFQMKEAIMNQEKLAKLQAQVRIGGKVTDKTNASSQVTWNVWF